MKNHPTRGFAVPENGLLSRRSWVRIPPGSFKQGNDLRDTVPGKDRSRPWTNPGTWRRRIAVLLGAALDLVLDVPEELTRRQDAALPFVRS